jgi:hypothetical protein
MGVPIPPGLKVYPGQRFALEKIAEHAPLSSERLGSYIHARRRDKGGHGHVAEEICEMCKGEGWYYGNRLRELGLVRHSDKRDGWYTVHFGLPPEPAAPAPQSAQSDDIPF